MQLKATASKFLGWLSWIWRVFTRRFWVFRKKRIDVAARTQALLPLPYDPIGLELKKRAQCSGGMNGDGLTANDPNWSPVTDRLDAKVFQARSAMVGAAEIGVYIGHDVGTAFAAIDQDFYNGVSAGAGHKIESFADLSHRVSPHTLSERWDAAFDQGGHGSALGGHVNDHTGRVGEAVLQRHLEDAGIEAKLASNPSEKGWDIEIEGHQVQVKTVDDASPHLRNHFANSDNSHIPVLVSGDAEHIPADALHINSATGEGLSDMHHALESGSQYQVIADHGLLRDQIHDHVQHADTLLTGSHDTVHPHLPVVTMALSGFREVGLLFDGKTDLATAAKNAALDVGGTMVGGAVGAKAGAIAGTLIWPGVGTAIGGFLGAVFGAKTAREKTEEFKRQPFKEAFTTYETAARKFESKARELELDAAREWATAKRLEQKKLSAFAQDAHAKVAETTVTMQSWVAYDSRLRPEVTEQWLSDASEDIARLTKRIRDQYDVASWWRKWVWPDIEVIAQQEALRFLKRIDLELRLIRKESAEGIPVSREKLTHLLGIAGLMRERVEQYLHEICLEKQRRDRSATKYVSGLMGSVAAERRNAEKRLVDKMDAVKKRIRETLAPIIDRVKRCSDAAKIEARKLGIAV
jgi:hypothetical protein